MRRSLQLFGYDNLPTPAFAAFMRDVQIPGHNLRTIDNALQDRFFQRGPDGQPLERWELEKVEVQCPPDRIRQHLAACGFINETRPGWKSYTYAAWPGALVVRATARLADLVNAWQNGVRWEQTIVFGGQRPLQPDKESYEACYKVLGIEGAELEAARNWWGQINPQTELDMMKWVWRNTILPDGFAGAETIFVDAPMKPPVKEGGSPVRPTTEDTILEWLRCGIAPGSLLLSSGAPYGMAQDEAFWMLLEHHGFTVETFGHAAPDLPIQNLMREVAGCVNRVRKTRLAS